MADKNQKKQAVRPDLATWGGLVLALGGIVGGLILEGGNVLQIMQGTAAMIVFGGTLGAVMITTPLAVLKGSVKRFAAVLFERALDSQAVIDELIDYATKARKGGIVSLESEAAAVADPFLKKALNLAVDGTDLQELRKMMDLEIAVDESRIEAEAKVFEAAGGYAPTIGIIGAVLGLIQVMQHIADVDEVGKGIGVAFVATVYGVGSANILFLPAASKIRARMHQATQMKELMLEGVIGIVEGLNPKLIRIKLQAYSQAGAPPVKAAAKPQAPAAAPKAAPQ